MLDPALLFSLLHHIAAQPLQKKPMHLFPGPQAFSAGNAFSAQTIMCIAHGHIYLSPHLTIAGLATSEDTKSNVMLSPTLEKYTGMCEIEISVLNDFIM